MFLEQIGAPLVGEELRKAMTVTNKQFVAALNKAYWEGKLLEAEATKKWLDEQDKQKEVFR